MFHRLFVQENFLGWREQYNKCLKHAILVFIMFTWNKPYEKMNLICLVNLNQRLMCGNMKERIYSSKCW